MIKAGIVGYGFAGRSFHSYLIGLAKGLTLSTIATRDPVRQATAQVEQGVATCETIDDLFCAGLVEGYGQFVPLNILNQAVAEFLMEHPLANGVVRKSWVRGDDLFRLALDIAGWRRGGGEGGSIKKLPGSAAGPPFFFTAPCCTALRE